MSVAITCVTVDCAEPRALAEFWNTVLGWGGVSETDDDAFAICGPAGGGIYLEFVRVPEPKTVKNRLHLGCSAGSIDDLDIEIERLTALGATIAWEEEFEPEIATDYRNLVLRDPEGNEFCLSGRRAPA